MMPLVMKLTHCNREGHLKGHSSDCHPICFQDSIAFIQKSKRGPVRKSTRKKDDLKLSGIEIEGLADLRTKKRSVDSNNVSEKHDK
jgi:hypothetical protein